MSFEIKNNVFSVGKTDWQEQHFHGQAMALPHGTSYNSFLIRDEKSVIIDSVPKQYTSDYISKIKEIIELSDLYAVIALHGEPDHSGSLGHLLAAKPDLPVYCTTMGEKSLRGYYHKNWNFKIVKTGDKLNLGSRELTFIETPMLHWPDSMIAFLTNDNILFSSDIFGQHYASEFLYDDLVSNCELMWEAVKYYANVVTPYNTKAKKSLADLKSLNLPVELICPAHGVIWRKAVSEIINTYEKWADSYSENQISIIYDTMYESTRKMADAIAQGIRNTDKNVKVKIFNSSKHHLSDIVTEIFCSKGILIGCPTYNYGLLPSTAALLDEITGLKFSGKKAAAFGSYGWSPASTKIISERLEKSGFEIVGNGMKVNWVPSEDMLAQCRNFGAEFASSF